MNKRRLLLRIGFYCVVFALVLVMIYSGLRIVESTVFLNPGSTEQTGASKTIIRDGKSYFPRQDITVMLVMGIDENGPAVDSGYNRNPGAADVLFLVIFDETNRETTVLQLNRDTMLDMSTLSIEGKYAGTYYGQLALAHTYGGGMEDSCLNVKDTLENFLHGLTIDYYISMRMDALAILNDAVGGVTVTDDFSKVDPTIGMGEVTLRGSQAENFIRTRKDVGDQKNVSRMQRQVEYVEGFLEAFRAMETENVNFVLETYEAAAPYLVSNCPVNTLSTMIDRYEDYKLAGVISPEGENVIGEEYYEFYVDEEKLDQLILQLFYAEK